MRMTACTLPKQKGSSTTKARSVRQRCSRRSVARAAARPTTIEMTTVARLTTATKKAVSRAVTRASAKEKKRVAAPARQIEVRARQVVARVLARQTRRARVRVRRPVAPVGAPPTAPTLTASRWRRLSRASALYRTRSFSRVKFNSKKETFL